MDTWDYMRTESEVPGSGGTIQDILGPEYRFRDRVAYITGILKSIDAFYPQLWEEDLRKTSTRLEVPAYFLIGRHDVNASVPLCEEYFSMLRAPAKELVYFERSGHNPWSTESERFVQEVLRLTGGD